jgi:nicotinate-nucleotide--dimethylbenzimidazole phosphoribosyltransferase
MMHFNIEKPNDDILSYLDEKIDNLTKPKGSLGMLETLAKQIGWVQQSLNPKLKNPHHIVFAGDHGICAEGVSPSPQEVTYQMIANFFVGGAGVNFLARQHGFELVIVDSGVSHDFDASDPIINKKIRKGTRSYLHEAAMTRAEMELAVERGAECVQDCYNKGCNVICFGEMGISNTSSSALWMSCLTGIPLDRCVGAGCGQYGKALEHKYNVLKKSQESYTGDGSAEAIIAYFGGYEMVMALGGMLKAAELKMLILIDGFIMTSCLLAASKLNPNVLHYAIYGHQGDESGHKLLLEYLGGKPILSLGFRLGEGTGALAAYPIVDSAVRMLNEMSSFKEMKVTKYF